MMNATPPRQERAATLARELTAMGVAVISPLPLADGYPLRIRVLASLADKVLEELKAGAWDTHFITSGPEFRPDGSTPMSHVYTIDIPAPRTPVPDDRIPAYPLASPEKKSEVETEAIKRYLGIGSKP
jgi:hypothetical protein